MRDAVRENEAQGASHPPLHKTKISLTFYSRDSINHPSTTFISICRLLLTTLVKKKKPSPTLPKPNRSTLQTNRNNEALSHCHHYPSACVRRDGGPSTSGSFFPIFKSRLFLRSVKRRWEPRGLTNLESRTNVFRVRHYWEQQRVVA